MEENQEEKTRKYVAEARIIILAGSEEEARGILKEELAGGRLSNYEVGKVEDEGEF